MDFVHVISVYILVENALLPKAALAVYKDIYMELNVGVSVLINIIQTIKHLNAQYAHKNLQDVFNVQVLDVQDVQLINISIMDSVLMLVHSFTTKSPKNV